MNEAVREALSRSSVKTSIQGEHPLALSGSFVRMMEYFGLSRISSSAIDCFSKVLPRKCSGPVTHRGVSPYMCGERGCPNDDWVDSSSQKEDTKFIYARLFEAIKQPLFVWTLDFTLASDLWPLVPRSNLGLLRQIAYQCMQEYWNYVWGFPVKIGFDAVTQFWSSRRPGSHYVPHVHANQPRIFTETATGRVLTDVHVKYIDESILKQLWRSRVEAVLGRRSRAKVAGSYEKFSCKVNHITGLGAPNKNKGLDKRVRYMYRGIAFDYLVYAVRGHDYSHWDRNFVRWSLTFPHKRHQTYGLLAAKNLSPSSSFVRRIGLDIGTKRERDKLRSSSGHTCPECGCETEIDHDRDEDFRLLNRKEAIERGLEIWKSQVVDEDRKYRDYVPYNNGEN